MQIVGDIAERTELQGNEGLEELVKKFRKGSQVQNGNFPKINQYFQRQVKEKQEAVKKAFTIIPFMGGDVLACRNETLSLMVEYVAVEFGGYYDTLSPDLFKLEREICARATVVRKSRDRDEEEEEVRFRIPLFATADLSGTCWAHEESWSTGKQGCDLKEYNFTIKSTAPPLSIDVEQRTREVKARAHTIYAKALRDKKIGLAFNMLGIPCVSLRKYWIPKPSELEIAGEVEEKDPLLVAMIPKEFGAYVGNDPNPDHYRFYLISTWKVMGEEPYEHYLAEFTESKAKNNY